MNFDPIDKFYSNDKFKTNLISTTREMKPIKKAGYTIANMIIESKYYLYHNKEIYYYYDGLWRPNGVERINSFVFDILAHNCETKFMNEINKFVKSKTFIETIPDPPKDMLPVTNGLINYKTNEFRPYQKEDYIFYKADVVYDPKAICPKFYKSLTNDLDLSDEEVITIIQFFGYCLLPSYPVKQFLIFYGLPDTGKTTILNVLRKFIGEKNCSGFPINVLDDKFVSSFLALKFANIAGETGNISSWKSNTLKAIIGSDQISTEKKFKEADETRLYVKFCFANNDWPQNNDFDEGLRSKAVIIKFEKEFTPGSDFRKDEYWKQLSSPQELSGILNWALEDLKTLISDGHFRTYNLSKGFKHFLESETTSLTKHNDASDTLLSSLYFSYHSYCIKYGMIVPDIKSFSHMIEEAGHPKSKKSGRYIVPSLILI